VLIIIPHNQEFARRLNLKNSATCQPPVILDCLELLTGPVGTKCLWNKKVRDISYEFLFTDWFQPSLAQEHHFYQLNTNTWEQRYDQVVGEQLIANRSPRD